MQRATQQHVQSDIMGRHQHDRQAHIVIGLTGLVSMVNTVNIMCSKTYLVKRFSTDCQAQYWVLACCAVLTGARSQHAVVDQCVLAQRASARRITVPKILGHPAPE